MPENATPDYFADTVMDLMLVNGVYRLTLAKQGENREFSPAVRVFIPAPKLAAVLRGVERASAEILGKLQARTDGRNLEGETMVQIPEEVEEPQAEAVAEDSEKSIGPLELGKKLVRKVAAKAGIKKSSKKASKKAPEKASKKAPEKAPKKAPKKASVKAAKSDSKKAVSKKESGGKSKKAPKTGTKKDSKKDSKKGR